jgi:hypothetical protein
LIFQTACRSISEKAVKAREKPDGAGQSPPSRVPRHPISLELKGPHMSWDEAKLASLKAKYGESHGGELFDPTFQGG